MLAQTLYNLRKAIPFRGGIDMNMYLLNKAAACQRELFTRHTKPIDCFHLQQTESGWEAFDRMPFSGRTPRLNKGDSLCLDFGTHWVGYLSFSAQPVGGAADAPAYLRIIAGERLCEIGEDPDDYHGGLGKGWLQVSHLHLDELPCTVELPRRYAFRYLKIEVLDTSCQYGISLSDVGCQAVSAVREEDAAPLVTDDPFLNKMDEVSLRTLRNCAQDVFEDGPKRDRRLWLGDLRLQALTAYRTYRAHTLARRCLYLFAGLTGEDGGVSACVYTKPTPHADDLRLFDYSLFFVSCLSDYWEATGDTETVTDLWPTAWRQLELAAAELDERGVIRDKDTWWCFLDWNDDLNKQAGAQGVFIMAVRQGLLLSKRFGTPEQQDRLNGWLEIALKGSRQVLWDKHLHLFVSGQNRQISWASQVWLVLAEVWPTEKSRELLLRTVEQAPAVGMVTPYMFHHWVEALLSVGLTDLAKQELRRYWGGMLKAGADCFWELYDPTDPDRSPYGSPVINSCCHAWSCTPAYFFRRYPELTENS